MSTSILARGLSACQVYQFPVSKQKTKRERVAGLSYYPRLGRWKASNVTLDQATLEARSYGWWIFVKRIGGKLVFNDYRYSNTTARHQQKVRQWLKENGIEYVSIESPRGLQNLNSAIEYYRNEIKKLETEIANPRSKAHKNADRHDRIGRYLGEIATVHNLMKSVQRE